MMLETMGTLFTNLIGTLAVLVVIAFFVAGSEALSNFTFKSHYWKFDVLAGCMGGLFGVYGNDRLLKCLESAADQDVDQILETVRKGVRQHVKEADQFDDITMVCMEYQG